MPAYRERVYIGPDLDGQPGWVRDFPAWWDRAGFFKQFGARQVDAGDPFHDGYGVLLTAWEALAWNKACWERYALGHRDAEGMIGDEMRRWEALLANARWVVVESYEWESGLD